MSAGTAGARRWDDLVKQIAGHSADAHIIVDIGIGRICRPSPLRCHQRGALDTLLRRPSTGGPHRCYRGQALVDTLHGAAQLVEQLEDARFVVWLNPFWGPVLST